MFLALHPLVPNDRRGACLIGYLLMGLDSALKCDGDFIQVQPQVKKLIHTAAAFLAIGESPKNPNNFDAVE